MQSLRAAGAVLFAGLLAACGHPPHSGSAGSPPAAPATSLAITVAPTTEALPTRWTLTCAPTNGSLPHAAAACAFIAKNPAAVLAPGPAHQACSMIYGGPQVATVRGRWRGSAVDARITRVNGCEVARWVALRPLIGGPA